MTEWTLHIPKFGGDAPEGMSLDTHYVECRDLEFHHGIAKWGVNTAPNWHPRWEYRYRPRAAVPPPPATYEQVCAWHIANGSPVPERPVDYEAWEPVLNKWDAEALNSNLAQSPFDGYKRKKIDGLIAAFRVAMTIPECREAIEG